MAGHRKRPKLDPDLVHLASTPSTSPGHMRPPSLEDLPEDLLHTVTSQLTVKEAGRTSVLSSRWRERWTHHYDLRFDGTSSELAGYDADRFVAHVTKVLQRHSGFGVDRFELRSPALGKEHAHHLDRWLGFVGASKAKRVVLDLSPLEFELAIVASPDNKYRLPASQLVGIVSLLLGHVSLELPAAASDGGFLLGFKALKKLELKFIADLGHLTPFISNCPALEWLSIYDSFVLDLVVPPQARRLRYLRVAECGGVRSIHLLAASLTTFECHVSAPRSVTASVKADDALKLSQASIKFYWVVDTVGYFWDELSCWLAPVDRLELSVSMDTETTRFVQNPTKFIHLRHLTLYCRILGDPKSALVVLRLTQILESAPQLEHFVLHLNSFYSSPQLFKTTDCIRPRTHHHLRTVHMTGLFGFSGQLELAKYILLSANALEFMTLNLARNGYPHTRWAPNHTYFTMLEAFVKNYLDPQGVYHDILRIVGLTDLTSL